jgi:hypothetical protein
MYTLAAPDPEQAIEGSIGGAKATRPRGWVSLGSEAEIEMESVCPTRPKVYIKF